MAAGCDWQREVPSAVSHERTSISRVIVQSTTTRRSGYAEWPRASRRAGRAAVHEMDPWTRDADVVCASATLLKGIGSKR